MDESVKSYKTIFKTTGLIGFVQIIQMLFSMVRNKALALIVGPSGIGIWGLYNVFVEMVTTVTSLGIDQSAVREISKNNDQESIGKTIWVFKKTMIFLSLFGTLIVIIFSKEISLSLFNTPKYHLGVIIVSFYIFFKAIFRSNYSILNGLREIKGLAKSQIIGSFIGAVASIIFVYIYKDSGIPLFILISIITLAISSQFYVKKLQLKTIRPNLYEFKNEFINLFTVGIGFSISTGVFFLMAYLSRIYLVNEYDMDTVGIYQASWTISNLYIGTILSAMGVDFMPRIMKVVKDKVLSNKLISEQIEFGLLFSSIGVILILIYAPIILNILYSSNFVIGEVIIRWQVLGVALRIFGFVFGFVIMAHRKIFYYVLFQIIIYTSDYFLLILFSKLFGFNYLGVNYFLSYLIYIILTGFFINKITGFKLSKLSYKLLSIEWISIIIILTLSYFLKNKILFYSIGSIFLIGYFIYLYNISKSLMGINLHYVLNKIKSKWQN